MRPRNPFAPVTERAIATGGIFGPSAQTVANAVGLLSSNLLALVVAVDPCLESGKVDALTASEFEGFREFVEKFIEVNQEPSGWSFSLGDVLAQVDQIQGQLVGWKARLATLCPDVSQIPSTPTRASTDDGPTLSVGTEVLIGGAIALGILFLWRLK